MGLFEGDRHVTGWCLGTFGDLGVVVETVLDLEGDHPHLAAMDASTTWSPSIAENVLMELQDVSARLSQRPPIDFAFRDDAFSHVAQHRSTATNALECFHNVDGEPLFDALAALCRRSAHDCLPVCFA